MLERCYNYSMIIKKNKFKLILNEIFVFIGIFFAISCLLEFIKPGVVLAYINTGYLLIFWLIISIILILSSRS